MPPVSVAPFLAVQQALSIFGSTNKADPTDPNATDKERAEEEYDSKLKESEIVTLTSMWKQEYNSYYYDIQKTQLQAYDYWIGKQYIGTMDAVEGRLLVDNLIFEATETFLPIATRANPEPIVSTENDKDTQSQDIAYLVKNALAFQADQQKLRLKLKAATRDWSLNRIGVVKIEWDVDDNDIKTTVINPKRMIFDKDGYVTEGGWFVGEYIGEKKRIRASRLIEMFPKKEKEIREKAQNKMGSKLEIIEWWYRGRDMFFTMGDQVLGKYKNPHWNYDGTEQRKNDTGSMEEAEIRGVNHFKQPKAPYVFLSVFSTRTQPHDDTSLILQNIPIQDLINKRYRQIDKNVDSQNNGLVVTSAMTSEQAALAANALRMGGAVRVPGVNVRDSFMRDAAPALAGDIFNQLTDARSELRNIYGTSGSTTEGLQNEDTARGKILVNQMDASRVGGGVTEFIEQMADSIYNYWLQMMYVHYDEPHYAAALGQQGASEIITLKNLDFNRIIVVTVKEGSLVPRDPLTQRNEAMDLWSANGIDPITFYKRLDFPDPYEAAKQLLVWQMIQKGALPPQMMFPDFQQPVQTALPQTQPGTGGPAVNPPTGQELPLGNPPLGTPPAEAQQSQQLISSIPLPK